MSEESARLTTKYLILTTVLVWIVWDIIAYSLWGGDATESETIGRWMDRSLWVTVFVFALVGHLLASGRAFAGWWQIGAVVTGLAIGYFATAK